MSDDEKSKAKENDINFDVKDRVSSTTAYQDLLESTPEEQKEDFHKALDQYSSQWQGFVDILKNATDSEEVKKGLMEELEKRYGKNESADN
jgi:hypothetical protein